MIIPAGFEDYRRIQVVQSMDELLARAPGGPDEVNALVLQRRPAGDFRDAAAKIRVAAGGVQHGLFSIAGGNQLWALLQEPGQPPETRRALRRMLADTRRLYRDFMSVGAVIMEPMHAPSNPAFQFKIHADPPPIGEGSERVLVNYDPVGTLLYRNEDAVLADGEERTYHLLPGAKPFILESGDVLRFLSCNSTEAPPLLHAGPFCPAARGLTMAQGRRQLNGG